jgi:hypothetical protein
LDVLIGREYKLGLTYRPRWPDLAGLFRAGKKWSVSDEQSDFDDSLSPKEIEEISKHITPMTLILYLFRFFLPAFLIIGLLLGTVWFLSFLKSILR